MLSANRAIILFFLAFCLSHCSVAQRAFFDYGYPLSLNEFKGVWFLGFGKTILGKNKLTNAYIKPNCSVYRFDKTYYYWNLELNLGGRLVLWTPTNNRNPFMFWALGEGGYGKMLGRNLNNDNALMISFGIGFSHAAVSGTTIFLMYQYQNHQGDWGSDIMGQKELRVIKIGTHYTPYNWR